MTNIDKLMLKVAVNTGFRLDPSSVLGGHAPLPTPTFGTAIRQKAMSDPRLAAGIRQTGIRENALHGLEGLIKNMKLGSWTGPVGQAANKALNSAAGAWHGNLNAGGAMNAINNGLAARRMGGAALPAAKAVAGASAPAAAAVAGKAAPGMLSKLKLPLMGLGALGAYKFMTNPSEHQQYMQQTGGVIPSPMTDFPGGGQF